MDQKECKFNYLTIFSQSVHASRTVTFQSFNIGQCNVIHQFVIEISCHTAAQTEWTAAVAKDCAAAADVGTAVQWSCVQA